MSNVLEFYLKMKDMMSSGLVKVAQTAKQSFGKVQGIVDNTISHFDKLKGKVEEIDRSANKSSFFNGSLFRKLSVAAAATAATAFASSSVNAAMNFGATTKSFEVLTGSKQKGGDLANTLNKLQQDTILGPEVFKSAQTMMSFGIATEKVVKVEKELGDVSMGNKDKFEALTLAFSQTQAAGKLMGQDLLQYINAGFNPLQVMSERWKDFGLKQKMSVGQLKDAMSQGKISAEMVSKAFELATGNGGKFNGMMDAIAQTSYGKMQILQGQWENFKIQSGNALMPIADELMTVASKTMDWLNITKTAPQVLTAEKGEISSLLGVITSLNEKNNLRHTLLSQLVVKYPDLFGKMDIENVKNSQLLKTLNDINGAYEKRINLATSDLIVDTNSKMLQGAQTDFTKYATVLELMKRGDNVSMSTAKKLLSFSDMANLSTGLAFKGKPTENDKNMVQLWMQQAQQTMKLSQGSILSETTRKSQNEDSFLVQDAIKLRNSPEALKSKFGKNMQAMQEFLSMAKQLKSFMDENGTMQYYTGHVDLAKLRNSITPSKATGKGDANTKVSDLIGGGKDSVARGVTGGGPRVINVHIDKMVEKIEINNKGSVKESAHEIETQVKEVFLRVLNSGASVQ